MGCTVVSNLSATLELYNNKQKDTNLDVDWCLFVAIGILVNLIRLVWHQKHWQGRSWLELPSLPHNVFEPCPTLLRI